MRGRKKEEKCEKRHQVPSTLSGHSLNHISKHPARSGAPLSSVSGTEAAQKEGRKVVFFYRQGDAFGEFSNFFKAAVHVHGTRYATTEHFFQSQKFVETDPRYAEAVRLAKSPGDAARMGRSRAHPLSPTWEADKDDIMRTAVRAKFAEHPELAQLLIRTGDSWLCEHTGNDAYWGDGGDGHGRNMLGRILMEVRNELNGGAGKA